MNHKLVLILKRIKRLWMSYRFRLRMRNESDARLLLPYPDETDLRFIHPETNQAAESYLNFLENSDWGGLVLEPGEESSFDFVVWPMDIAESRPWKWLAGGPRWVVELPRTRFPYLVYFQYCVAADYFDPGSHWRLPQLKHRAESEKAVVWMGEVQSNRLHVMRG